MGKVRNVHEISVGKPEGKKPVGTSRRKWKDNIKMDLKELNYECVALIQLAQDTVQCFSCECHNKSFLYKIKGIY
jgi:hypothetical protein